jgi:hypothetical protein
MFMPIGIIVMASLALALLLTAGVWPLAVPGARGQRLWVKVGSFYLPTFIICKDASVCQQKLLLSSIYYFSLLFEIFHGSIKFFPAPRNRAAHL